MAFASPAHAALLNASYTITVGKFGYFDFATGPNSGTVAPQSLGAYFTCITPMGVAPGAGCDGSLLFNLKLTDEGVEVAMSGAVTATNGPLLPWTQFLSFDVEFADGPLRSAPVILDASRSNAGTGGALTSGTFDLTFRTDNRLRFELTVGPGNIISTGGSDVFYNFAVTTAAVPAPVPAAIWLLASSVVGVGAFSRRRRLNGSMEERRLAAGS